MNESVNARPAITHEAKIVLRNQGGSINVLGDSQRVLIAGEETRGQLTLIENHNPPGIGPPLHIHRNEDELFYVLEGEVEFTADGETTVCSAGTTIYLPRTSVHTWQVVGTQHARMLILATPAGLENYFRGLSELTADGQPPDIDQLLALSAEHGIEFPELTTTSGKT